MSTVLTPFNAQALITASLTLRYSQAGARNVAAKQELIATDYEQRIGSVRIDAEKTRGVEKGIESAQNFISSTLSRVRGIDRYLDQMLSTVQQLTIESPPEAFSGSVAMFDSMLFQITQTANQGESPNLLGQQPQSDYSYQSTSGGARQTIYQSFLGSDYYIDDTTGMRWIREGEYSKQLVQIDPATGAKTGRTAAVTGGVQLDSIVGDTVEFTYSPNTADTQQFTGTLHRSGLGVLDIWLYQNLATSSGRDRASADIYNAKLAIDGELTRYVSAGVTSGFYLQRNALQVSGFQKTIDDLMKREVVELQAEELKQARLNQVQSQIFASEQTTRNQYFKLLARGAAGGNFTKALLSAYG